LGPLPLAVLTRGVRRVPLLPLANRVLPLLGHAAGTRTSGFEG